MKKIIQRNITNGDGDVYGIVGNVTRLEAYRAIRADLRGYGIEDEVEFKPEDLEQCNFWETEDQGGEFEHWTWWEKPDEKLNPKPLGVGWIYKVY